MTICCRVISICLIAFGIAASQPISSAYAQVLVNDPAMTAILQTQLQINTQQQAKENIDWMKTIAQAKASYDQATQQFTGISPQQWGNLQSIFKQALSSPDFINQTTQQSTANIKAYESTFKKYAAGQGFISYNTQLAQNSETAAQNALNAEAKYNHDLATTHQYTTNLLNQPPQTQMQALNVMTVLLQQNIEQLGKLGTLLGAESSSITAHNAKIEAQQQDQQLQMTCQAEISHMYRKMRELDANISLATVTANVKSNSLACK